MKPLTVVQFWRVLLSAIPALIAEGLAAFGAVFAMHSSIHSSMVLACTDVDSVSLNVGFLITWPTPEGACSERSSQVGCPWWGGDSGLPVVLGVAGDLAAAGLVPVRWNPVC